MSQLLSECGGTVLIEVLSSWNQITNILITWCQEVVGPKPKESKTICVPSQDWEGFQTKGVATERSGGVRGL